MLVPRINHVYMEKCIRYSIPKLINDTPDHIRNKLYTHSLKGFANYVKHIYIKEYQLVCNIPNCYICRPL